MRFLHLQAQEYVRAGAMTWITPVIKLETNAGAKECSWPELDMVLQAQDLQWGSTSWGKACNSLRDAILGALRAHMQTDNYLRRLQETFKDAVYFGPCCHINITQLKLERFSAVYALIDQELLPGIVRQTLPKRMATLNHMVEDLFSRHSGELMPADAFETLQRRIEGRTVQDMLAQLSSLGDPNTIPPGFELTECESTAAARAALRMKGDKLEAARQTIDKLAGISAMDSYASAVSHEKFDAKRSDEGAGVDGAYYFVWPHNKRPVPKDLPQPVQLARVAEHNAESRKQQSTPKKKKSRKTVQGMQGQDT